MTDQSEIAAASSDFARVYRGFTMRELRAVVGAPEGEYRPEAVAAARSELAARSADDAEEPPMDSVSEPGRQPRWRTPAAIVLLLLGMPWVTAGAAGAALWLATPRSDRLWPALAICAAGAIPTLVAWRIDGEFWSHASRVYGIVGFCWFSTGLLRFLLVEPVKDADLAASLWFGGAAMGIAVGCHYLGRRKNRQEAVES